MFISGCKESPECEDMAFDEGLCINIPYLKSKCPLKCGVASCINKVDTITKPTAKPNPKDNNLEGTYKEETLSVGINSVTVNPVHANVPYVNVVKSNIVMPNPKVHKLRGAYKEDASSIGMDSNKVVYSIVNDHKGTYEEGTLNINLNSVTVASVQPLSTGNVANTQVML